MDELALGTTLNGRFVLDRFLGEGGMGAVWAAHHVLTGKLVALKVLKGDGDEHRRRFVQEARIAAAVRHPNVVDIHDVVELPDGRPVLVMDLLDGEPLSSYLAHRGLLEAVALARLMLPVLAGVGAAHAVGIVHRDLKPENVFLSKNGSGETTVKVLDFGIAKLTALSSAIRHTAALTQTGSVLGTPMYMAPEQVFGEKGIDHRADIWSLGILMYECLTGSCPIEGDNVGQIFKSISQRTFPSLRERLPALTPGIAQLVDSMLEIRPEDRPDSVRIVAEQLAFHTGLEVPTIEDPRWLPGSQRRPHPDPTAPTEANIVPRKAWRKRAQLAGGLALVACSALLGWRLTAGARTLEAEPPSSLSIVGDEAATATSKPGEAAASTGPSLAALAAPAPSTSPSTSASVRPAIATASARPARSAATTQPSSGPGGIHAASPY